MSAGKIKVTVWNEYGDRQKSPPVAAVYPAGLHKAIADFLNKDGEISASCSILTDP